MMLRVTKPDVKVDIKPPRMDLKLVPAEMNMHTTSAEISIDLQPSFNTMGLQDIESLSEEFGAEAKQAAMEGIERRVSEGESLAKPHGPSIGQVMSNAATHPREKQLVVAATPSVPPAISATLGKVEVQVVPGRVAVINTNLDVSI
ncbi:hypothetical protein Ga0466249_000226 [Sporomusaceae bacterium BoRhaA]|uniref:DUF6470 family protein n=1 Tax=Pelorhabdus rhamnosifermentans TaxID=2772457 RepID=UPI001C06400C|nr:DUF6470 family protein [Pelorhabdus rhamnosifermentans]MBU2699147.1 hypothetical protein [Pelorhabdus rhamnosifermentans]